MEMIPLTENGEEREEGEIIDDLEDVSDSSMFPGSPEDCGKSVSPPELLSAVCLSSSLSSNDYYRRNSYDDETVPSHNNNKQWKHKRKRAVIRDLKRRNFHMRHRRRVPIEILSDSDTDYVDPNYAKQLKDALKRESPQELHNSLRTRLKGFIEPGSDDENALRNIALHSTKVEILEKNESESNPIVNLDKDLIKENFEDHELYQLRMDALKSVVMEKHEQRKKKNAKLNPNLKQEPGDIDKENDRNNDNELNSLKQISESNDNCDTVQQVETNLEKTAEGEVMDEDVDILRAMLLANMSKSLATKFPTATNATKELPVVKKMAAGQACVANHMIIKPLIINVNDSDSDGIEGYDNSIKATVTQFLKQQRAEAEEKVKKKETSLNKSDDSLMDKSVLKLLPRSQQLEYRQLKQRLINARKKNKLRRSSQRVSESKREQTPVVKKVPKVSSNNSPIIKVTKSVQERKNTQSSTNLQKTLNELQIRKNGRLQMKGKYRSLGVLLHKINQASNVRSQYEVEVKKQLHELQKLRIKLATSHENFTNLVQQLVREKQVIDQRTYKIVKAPAPVTVPVTSTPKSTTKSIVQNSVPIPTPTIEIEKELLEPNDVTKVFVKEPDAMPKYISPLDNRDGIGINDPLMTLCPYDVLGTCKDKECQYMHCA
ncbi:uncharacterized protein LOC116167793 isoform X2 [Photinus pyralis]|uniref:uncharacterized protein LOC116167793 isoform X2 n=1 Tax=Photinus pyralis TaxID=7054 RepID=UPI0012678198|nr:uncharacterized protein LOC116167793 isoform X2 [Photinus pyralis]